MFAPQLPVPAQSTWTHTPVIVSAVDINSVTMVTGGIQMSVVVSARRISCIVGGRKLQTPHHVSVSVAQTILAHLAMGRHSMNLLVSVNALQHSIAVRVKSLIQIPASVFVRLYKIARQVSFSMQIYVSVYVKVAYLRSSGTIDFVNVKEITKRFLARSHVAVNVHGT